MSVKFYLTLIKKFLFICFCLAISTFLSLGIISIRVSGDIPIQSSYLPLISVFFILNLLFIFVAFGWFCVSNQFRTKRYLPKFLSWILGIFSKKTKALIKNTPLVVLNKIDGVQVQDDNAKEKKENEIFEMKIARLNSIAFIIMLSFISLSYTCIFGNVFSS